MLEKSGFFNLIKKNLLIVIFFLSFFFFMIISLFGINILDEGFYLYSSLQILDGKLPYKDIFIPYTPGLFYFNALIFKLFGINLLYPRIFQDLILASTSVLIFLLSKKIMSEKFAVIASIIYILGISPKINTPWPGWYALFFGFLAIYFVTTFIEREQNYRYLCFSGIFTVLSIIFKQNIGALTLFSIMIFLLIQSLIAKSDYQKQSKKFLAYCFGIIICAIPILFYLNYFSLTQFFLDNIYTDQINNFRSSMNIPFPSISEGIPLTIDIKAFYTSAGIWMFYIPLLVFVLSIIVLSKKIVSSKKEI